MNASEKTEKHQLFAVGNHGRTDAWSKLLLQHPKLGAVAGKQFLGQALGLTGMEVSLNSLATGHAVPFEHGHRKNEELYLFISGEGQMLLDGQVLEVQAGSAVRISPSVLRCWRNTGEEPLVCVVIQAQEHSLTQCTEADGFISSHAPAWPQA